MAGSGYKTKQRDLILNHLMAHQREHVTADDIVDAFRAQEIKVGKSTIYRYLDILVQGGQLRKYTIDEMSSACYQYVDSPDACATHYHLKCTACGCLLHIESDLLPVVSKEIFSQYGFAIDHAKTVFYGKCKACIAQETEASERGNENEKDEKADCGHDHGHAAHGDERHGGADADHV